MLEILHHTLIDTLKSVPILFVVYLIIEYLEAKVNTARIFGGKLERFGPIFGALADACRNVDFLLQPRRFIMSGFFPQAP